MINTFNKRRTVSVVIDGQFGSTGKGLIAAHLALASPPDIAVTNASANAGHTTVFPNGSSFITYHLPTAGIVVPSALIYLDAGAIINPEVFADEVVKFNLAPGRVAIHPNAAVITPDCIEEERRTSSGQTKIGSTQKGVGVALARKAMRIGMVAKDHPYLSQFVRRLDLDSYLRGGASVMVEVPQGHSLSTASDFYPHCTSRQISVAQALADAELSPRWLNRIMMTARTFPIRVGNIYGGNGQEIGNSGGWWPDQRELTWEELAQKPEITTVTKRQRRIATFSLLQYERAAAEIWPTDVFLNFCNYLPNYASFVQLARQLSIVHDRLGQIGPLFQYGFGPKTDDIHNGDEVSMSNFFTGESQ